MAYSAIPFPAGGAGGSFDGRRILNTWIQGNSFLSGEVVYQNGSSGLALAIANGATSSNAVGIVESADTNSVTVVYQGEIDFGNTLLGVDDNATSLTAGTVYYISPCTAGYLSPKKPTAASTYVAPVLIATGAKKGIVVNSLDHGSVFASVMTPVGSIIPWAGGQASVPTTWTFCDGRALQKTSQTYNELYTVIGDKYSVMTLASVTADQPNYDTVTLQFTGDGHEDGTDYSIHNLNEVYQQATNKDFVIGWGGTNDYAVATLVGTNVGNRTVTLQWKTDYTGTNPAGTALQNVQLNSPVTIRSLSQGEVAGYASDYFFIPDLRARTVMGAGYTVGLAELRRGAIGGNQTHLLTTNEVPDHETHFFTATGDNGSSGIPALSATAFTNATDPKNFDTSFTSDNDPISIMPPYVVTNWIIRHARYGGAGVEIGPKGDRGDFGPTGPTGFTGTGLTAIGVSGGYLIGQYIFGDGTTSGNINFGWALGPTGETGPTGPKGETGERCECSSLQFSQETSIWLGDDTPNKDGVIGGALPSEVLFASKLSTNPNWKTDFNYAMNSSSSSTIPWVRPVSSPWKFVDPGNAPNSEDYRYHQTVARRPSPYTNIPFNTTGVNNISFVDNYAQALMGPAAWILGNGVYTMTRPWFNGGSRPVYIGAEENSVETKTVSGVKVEPYYSGIGETSMSAFVMTFTVAGGTAGIDIGTALVVKGVSAGIDGLTTGVGGFFNNLVGGYVVQGISGPQLSVLVRNESGTASWYTPYLGNNYNNYITELDAYKVTVHTTSNAGALFTDYDSTTYVGNYTLPSGTVIDGIALVNDSTGGASPIGLSGYVPEGFYNNATALATRGGNIEVNGCVIVNYPTAAYAIEDGSISIRRSHITDSYYGSVADDNAMIAMEGCTVARTAIPAVADNSSILRIGADMSMGSPMRSKLVANRSPVVAKNGSTVNIENTTVRGPAVYAERSTVSVGKFVDLHNSNKDTTITETLGATPAADNMFTILVVDSTVSMPAMQLQENDYDPVTQQQKRKMNVLGIVQSIDSKIKGSLDKTVADVRVSTATKSESVRDGKFPNDNI